ncbi:hypothetical protein [Flammeovirga sp. SJP92]|uniref:hypothetical protein n=1 Tax=Flammeovirga sp. SJP92 TaxID=1775430 RepID=UPI00078922A9|nr:hypothetical protein [Flammeovirga sp. SJP92]KXX69720.1 hypothetical protein AVL50_12560 [Flammeovirga sp. SJP92]
MLQKTENKTLLPFQRKKDVYIPVSTMGQLEIKSNKFIHWFIKIVSPTVGIIETCQIAYAYYHFGLGGVNPIDAIGFSLASLSILLHPTFLFKPKKAWPFSFISFEEDKLIFNVKFKTKEVFYKDILRFEVKKAKHNRLYIYFFMKDGTERSEKWLPENMDKDHVALRLAINEELQKRIDSFSSI